MAVFSAILHIPNVCFEIEKELELQTLLRGRGRKLTQYDVGICTFTNVMLLKSLKCAGTVQPVDACLVF